MQKDLRVAIVHDYLHTYGGAEALVNAIWESFPEADIFTATYDKQVMEKVGAFKDANIIYPKWKNNIPGFIKNFSHKFLVANLPFYFENLDLSSYDLILSSTAHFAKGVITHPSQLHISYIHTPPRFLYKYPGDTSKRQSRFWNIFLRPLDMFLRIVDYNFAQRPDYLICNSENVKRRIKKFYRRESRVIHPFPQVEIEPNDQNEGEEQNAQTDVNNSKQEGEYYLVVSRLSPYKNVDLVIETCGKHNIPLKIAGTGISEQDLRKLASKYSSVEMLGLVDQDKKQELYKNCKAFIAAVKDEDFGMAPLEPMMFGKPVIALKEAGYLETVEEPKTGIFFEEIKENSLLSAINKLEQMQFDPQKIKNHAQKFSKQRFQKEYKDFVKEKLEKHQNK